MNLVSEIAFKRLVSWGEKVRKNPITPPSSHKGKPVATINKQSMGYFIVKDIESATSYLKREWAIFALKELLDNAYDWLDDNYPGTKPEGKEKRRIVIRIWITGSSNADSTVNKFIHIAVRNSNVDNILEFTKLEETFDYDIWYSTKRGQHRGTTGGLGDALKRILAMGYAAWSESENKSEEHDAAAASEETIEFELEEEKQWNEPIIVRSNETERRCFLTVEMSKGNRWVKVKPWVPTRNIGTDTEVEVTLPAVRDSGYQIYSAEP
jgi:hypothetical protein